MRPSPTIHHGDGILPDCGIAAIVADTEDAFDDGWATA